MRIIWALGMFFFLLSTSFVLTQATRTGSGPTHSRLRSPTSVYAHPHLFTPTHTRLHPRPPVFDPHPRVSTHPHPILIHQDPPTLVSNPQHSFWTPIHAFQPTTTRFEPTRTCLLRLHPPTPDFNPQPCVWPHRHPVSCHQLPPAPQSGPPAPPFNPPAPISSLQHEFQPTTTPFKFSNPQPRVLTLPPLFEPQQHV